MIAPPKPSEVLLRHDTDKAIGVPQGHSYGRDLYDKILPTRRWCKAVLEIGAGTGGSLRAWKEYCPEAVIVCLEIDRNRLVFEHRIFSIRMDVSDPVRLEQFACEYRDYFTVIIDDGDHKIDHQLLTLRTLKKCLTSNGVYVVEDIEKTEYADQFRAEGCEVHEWQIEQRFDNRVAVYTRGV